jgi:hypothetical protein
MKIGCMPNGTIGSVRALADLTTEDTEDAEDTETEPSVLRQFRQVRSDGKESEASSGPASGVSVRSVVGLNLRIRAVEGCPRSCALQVVGVITRQRIAIRLQTR